MSIGQQQEQLFWMLQAQALEVLQVIRQQRITIMVLLRTSA